jgi:hypothetical protein
MALDARRQGSRPKHVWRRWLQYRLPTLFGVLTVWGSILALFFSPAERQRRAIKSLERLNPYIEYEAAHSAKCNATFTRTLRSWLSRDYFEDVVLIDVSSDLVTDADLAHLRNLPRLRDCYLRIENSQVTDKGLSHLAGIEALQVLILDDTRVSDAGIRHLSNSNGLLSILLDRTHVTDKAMATLAGLTTHPFQAVISGGAVPTGGRC